MCEPVNRHIRPESRVFREGAELRPEGEEGSLSHFPTTILSSHLSLQQFQ